MCIIFMHRYTYINKKDFGIITYSKELITVKYLYASFGMYIIRIFPEDISRVNSFILVHRP